MYLVVVVLETYMRSVLVSRRIKDIAENVRWVVVSPYKMLLICWIAYPTECISVSIPQDTIYVGLAEELNCLRNVEDVIYCLADYAMCNTSYVIDDFIQKAERQSDLLTKTYPLLHHVGYTDVLYDDVVEIVNSGQCTQGYTLSMRLEELSRRTAQFTSLDVHYRTFGDTYTAYKQGVVSNRTAPLLRKPLADFFAVKAAEQFILPTELSIQCHDVMAKQETLYSQDAMYSNCYAPYLLCTERVQRGFTLSQLCHIPVCDSTAYCNGLTKDLLYTVCYMDKQYSIQTMRIDGIGYLYINEHIVNYIVDYNTLVHIANDDVWRAITGYTQNEFYSLYNTRYQPVSRQQESIELTQFVQILQEQHIPRWGMLLDFTQLTELMELRHLEIDNPEIVQRCYLELTVSTGVNITVLFRKLTPNNMYVCGCAANVPIKEMLLRAVVYMSNTLRKYVGLPYDKLLADRTLKIN